MPRVLADYDAAIDEARRLARGQRDLIRVGYLGSAAQMFLDPTLSALRGTHLEVKVKLLDLSLGQQIVALRKGEIDLALIGQEGALLSNEFYIRKGRAAQARRTIVTEWHIYLAINGDMASKSGGRYYIL